MEESFDMWLHHVSLCRRMCVYIFFGLFSDKKDSQVSLTSGFHDCGLWIAWKGTSELYKPKKTVYNIRCNITIYLSYWETWPHLTNCFRYYSSDRQCTQSTSLLAELLSLCFGAFLPDECFHRAAPQRSQNNLCGKGAQELSILSSCHERDQLRDEEQAAPWPHARGAFPYVEWEPLLFQFLCLVLPLCAAGSSLASFSDDLLIGGGGAAPKAVPASGWASPVPSASPHRWPFAELTRIYQCSPGTGRDKTGCSISRWSKGCWPVRGDRFPWSLAGLLLMHPRVLVALSAARACFWLLFGLLSDTSPRYFSADQPGVCLPRCRTPHLSLLNCTRFMSACSSSPFRSFWMATLPLSVSAGLPSLMSYENLMSVHPWSLLGCALFTVCISDLEKC